MVTAIEAAGHAFLRRPSHAHSAAQRIVRECHAATHQIPAAAIELWRFLAESCASAADSQAIPKRVSGSLALDGSSTAEIRRGCHHLRQVVGRVHRVLLGLRIEKRVGGKFVVCKHHRFP